MESSILSLGGNFEGETPFSRAAFCAIHRTIVRRILEPRVYVDGVRKKEKADQKGRTKGKDCLTLRYLKKNQRYHDLDIRHAGLN
jgi:hypothetical protein